MPIQLLVSIPLRKSHIHGLAKSVDYTVLIGLGFNSLTEITYPWTELKPAMLLEDMQPFQFPYGNHISMDYY